MTLRSLSVRIAGDQVSLRHELHIDDGEWSNTVYTSMTGGLMAVEERFGGARLGDRAGE